jgi:hypothetical protein
MQDDIIAQHSQKNRSEGNPAWLIEDEMVRCHLITFESARRAQKYQHCGDGAGTAPAFAMGKLGARAPGY